MIFKRRDVSEFGGVRGGVSGGVQVVSEYIKEHPGVRVIHLQKALQIPVRTIERLIKQLKEEGKKMTN